MRKCFGGDRAWCWSRHAPSPSGKVLGLQRWEAFALGAGYPKGEPGSGIPPQHVELLLHFLVTIEKHKMLPVFPGQPCVWVDQGELSCLANRC